MAEGWRPLDAVAKQISRAGAVALGAPRPCGHGEEGQDTETVMRLYGLSRDNLYQIRTRLTAKLREATAAVLAEMDAPDVPNPRT